MTKMDFPTDKYNHIDTEKIAEELNLSEGDKFVNNGNKSFVVENINVDDNSVEATIAIGEETRPYETDLKELYIAVNKRDWEKE